MDTELLPRDRLGPARAAISAMLAPHQLVTGENGAALACFHSLALTSVFQPIVVAQDKRRVASEAYVRVASASRPALSPWNLFANAADPADVVRLDRLCRALHVANFAAGFARGEKLFLNVHPALPEVVKADFGLSFRRIIALLGERPERVVLELRFDPAEPVALVRDVIRGFRSRGFGVALDLGLGPTRTTLAAVAALDILPDYFKFTPSSEIDFASTALRRWQDEGVKLIGTRLGDAGGVAMAMAVNADLLQGYALARADAP